MYQFVQSFGGQVLIEVCIVVAACALAWQVRLSRAFPYGLDPAPTVLALGSGLAIAVATLTPRSNARSPGYLQTEPLATIRLYKWDSLESFVIYAGGNVALFVPLGFFLYLSLRELMSGAAFLVAVLLSGGASMTVEILQLPIWSRSTDVDDVILNTLGGVTGAALALGAVYLLRRYGYLGRPPAARAEPPRQYSYLAVRPERLASGAPEEPKSRRDDAGPA
ncbi:VanZ family protein [Spongisporangium articulatum]|uniref:VanZ family protein n=1 Tax=Spongisporangium articulatum TaxID=3362603 RepID=A0ABW8AL97_9ACTN